MRPIFGKKVYRLQPRLGGAADSIATGVSPWTEKGEGNPEPPQGAILSFEET